MSALTNAATVYYFIPNARFLNTAYLITHKPIPLDTTAAHSLFNFKSLSERVPN